MGVPLSREIRSREHRSRERERAERASQRERAVPLAYFITFTCHGTWLHAKDPLSDDRNHNLPGNPLVRPDPEREARERELMDQPPYEMDAPRRQVVLDTIREVSHYRG